MKILILGLLVMIIVTCHANVVRQRNYRNNYRHVRYLGKGQPFRRNEDARLSTEGDVGETDNNENNLKVTETQDSNETLVFTDDTGANLENEENSTAFDDVTAEETTAKEEILENKPNSLKTEALDANDAPQETKPQTQIGPKAKSPENTDGAEVAKVVTKTSGVTCDKDKMEVSNTTPENVTHYSGGIHIIEGVSPAGVHKKDVTTFSKGIIHTPVIKGTGISGGFVYPYTGKLIRGTASRGALSRGVLNGRPVGEGLVSTVPLSSRIMTSGLYSQGMLSDGAVSGGMTNDEADKDGTLEASTKGHSGLVKIGVIHSRLSPTFLNNLSYIGALSKKSNEVQDADSGIQSSEINTRSPLIPKRNSLPLNYYGYKKGNNHQLNIGQLKTIHISNLPEQEDTELHHGQTETRFGYWGNTLPVYQNPLPPPFWNIRRANTPNLYSKRQNIRGSYQANGFKYQNPV